MLQKFRTHPDAGIPDLEIIGREALRRIALLQNAHTHDTAGPGELHGIAQKIQKHLIQPEPVAQHMFIDHIRRINIKFQLFGCDIRLHDRLQVMHDLRQGSLLFLDLHFSALDTAHVQNIIDQAQQMIAGRGDLGQIILHLLLIVNMRRCQRGKADNCIHGGPDIMGHVVQERGLGPVRVLRRCQGILQIDFLSFQALLHLPLIIDVQKKSHKSDG